MTAVNDFERVIKQDRASRESKQWRGTLLEYLEMVKADPTFTKLSHARVYDLIMSNGTHNIQEADDPRTKRLYKDEPVKVYHFFADEFFGIERTIAQLVRYFHSASLKGEESRQVLYLMGPVGSGKSSLVERIQRGLEQASSVYAIEGCPMHEEPLHLIPRHLRREFEKMLGRAYRGRPLPGVPLPAQGRVRPALRGSARSRPATSPSATGSGSAWCRRSIPITRTPRC